MIVVPDHESFRKSFLTLQSFTCVIYLEISTQTSKESHLFLGSNESLISFHDYNFTSFEAHGSGQAAQLQQRTGTCNLLGFSALLPGDSFQGSGDTLRSKSPVESKLL